MNEMTESGAKGKGKGGKKGGAEGDASGDGQIARMLVRAIWAQEYSAANPDSKPEDRKAAWKETRAAQVEKNLKTYRRAIAALKRAGIVMTMSEAAAAATDEDPGEDA